MNRARDFRERARMALGGHWTSAVGTTLLAGILGGEICTSGGNGTGITSLLQKKSELTDENYYSQIFGNIPATVWIVLAGIIMGLVSIILIWALVQLFVGSFVSLGLIQYNLNLIDGKEVTVGQIFSKTSMFGKALWLRIRTALFVFLWTLLLIIPGIIMSYAYSMAGYIMTENPEMSAKEAMEVSKKMMQGNKWRLFCLQFSFIGWMILGSLTLGIGFLWINPYMNAAVTSFYDDISRETIEY